VNNNSLYFYLFDSEFSIPTPANFFPIVPVDSSAARIPFPGEQIFYAVSANSYLYLLFEAILLFFFVFFLKKSFFN
jgi:hypothetical protein